MIDFIKRNNALSSNPVMAGIGIHITKRGSSWLWAVFALFTFSFLVHAFHYVGPKFKHTTIKKNLILVPFITNLALSFAYYTYASNLGYAGQVAEFQHVLTGDGNYTRQIFYTKYIGWFLSWPLVLLTLSIATSTFGDNLTNDFQENFTNLVKWFFGFIARVIGAELFVVGLLVGSLIHSTYKWGYFVFAVVAQLFVVFLYSKALLKTARVSVNTRLVSLAVALQLFIWLLYPLCWALSEGGNVLQPDSEAVFYGILDLCTFGVIPTSLTWLNIQTLDDEFFRRLIPIGSHYNEKVAVDHRHSGDTAVNHSHGLPNVATDETSPQPEVGSGQQDPETLNTNQKFEV